MRLTAAATRNGLYHDRLLVDSGGTRDTASGRPAIVWRVPRKGERVPAPPKKKVSRAQWRAVALRLRELLLRAPNEAEDEAWLDEALAAIDTLDMLEGD